VVAPGPLLPAAAKQGLDARQELLERKGFGEAVVGAQAQAADLVLGVAQRGEHQHRHVVAFGAQRLAQLEAAQAGEHQVQQQQRQIAAARAGGRG